MNSSPTGSKKPAFNNTPEGRADSQLRLQNQNRPGHLEQMGTPASVETRLDEIERNKANQTEPITEVSIVIIGDEIKPLNSTCLCLTIIGGCFLCLPWLCFCCGWWKKTVWPCMEIPQRTYDKLEVITKIPTIKKFSLMVTDNKFNKEKADILYKQLSKSSITYFQFINLASETNWDDKEYSNFVENMRPIKSLPNARSDIKWNSKPAL